MVFEMHACMCYMLNVHHSFIHTYVEINENMAPMLMNYGDPNAKKIDRGLSNVFRWPWMDEEVSYNDHKNNTQTVKIGTVLKKSANRGVVWCEICDKEIAYGSSGKKALKLHLCGVKHISQLKIVRQNESITVQKDALMITAKNMNSLKAKIANLEVLLLE